MDFISNQNQKETQKRKHGQFEGKTNKQTKTRNLTEENNSTDS